MSEVQGDNRLEEETPPEAVSDTAEPATSSTEDGGADASPAEPAKVPRTRARSPRSAAAGTTRRTTKAAAEAPATEAETPAPEPEQVRTVPRMLELYRSEVVPAMLQEFGYKNVVQVPKLKKVVLNIGLGEALTNPRAMETATKDLTTISGQKPIITRARKSIAGFKLREGNPIGMYVTLRGARMYQFMDRLVNAALPRIRDFRGVPSTSFDGRGNYSLGIREQIIFPEIDYGQIERIRGLQVTINTTANTDAEATRLLALMGMPFVRQN